MRIIFLRHGTTEANIKETFSDANTPLAKDGYKILDRSKIFLEKYDIKKVYTSKLLRARQSAEYLGFKDYICDERINEIDVGDFKGLKYDFVLKEFSENLSDLNENPMLYKYPNGESKIDVIKRVTNFMDDICKQEGDILCISHGIAIRSALFWVLEDYENYENFRIDNASLTVFKYKDNKKLIECVNLIWTTYIWQIVIFQE